MKCLESMNICAPHTSHLLTTLPNRLYLDLDLGSLVDSPRPSKSDVEWPKVILHLDENGWYS